MKKLKLALIVFNGHTLSKGIIKNQLLFVSSLLIILLSSCVTITEKYALKFEDQNQLSRASYIRNEYELPWGVNTGEAETAYQSILLADISNKTIEIGNELIEQSTEPLKQLKIAEDVAITILTNLSKFWNSSINRSPIGVSYREALQIYFKEQKNENVYHNYNEYSRKVKEMFKEINIDEYKYTFESYAIFQQLSELVNEPDGSLVSFNMTINNLHSDFTKSYALAEME